MIFQRVNLYKYYQDSVEEMRNRFKRLNLVMDGEAAIRFADTEVLRVLTTESAYIDYPDISTGYLSKIDRDGDGMIDYSEAASIQSLSKRADRVYSLFYQNTKIETFNEFQYFVGLKKIAGYTFCECTSLREITLPPTITIIDSRAFMNTGIEHLIIPEGVTTIKDNAVQSCIALRIIDLPSTIVELGDSWFRECSSSINCRAITPPNLIRWGYNANPTAIYVPVGCGAAYRTATNWSQFSSRIQEYDFN